MHPRARGPGSKDREGRFTTTIDTSIDIAAAPETVWAVLTDFAAYPDWNPFVTSIDGPLAVGGRLTVRIAPPGGRGMTFRPRLLVVEPKRELRWLGRFLVPGVLDGEHWFRIEKKRKGVLFRHGERFTGVVTAVFRHKALEAAAKGFESMNTALRDRVEAKV